MFIDDYSLRGHLRKILTMRTRNQIVQDIKERGEKMHQYNIDRFLQGKPIGLETAKKLDKYVYRFYNGLPPE